jgi:predicted small secreted protein
MRFLLLFTCLTITLTGCNTFTGIGRDLAYLGNSMSDFASDVRGEPANPQGHVPAPDYSSPAR